MASKPPDTNAPNFVAWHVSDKGENSYWHKVGAAWLHPDKKGLSLLLEVVPINGKIVMRELKEDNCIIGVRPWSRLQVG